MFPKHYVYNFHEPETYPYEGTPCDASGLNADTCRYEGALPGNDWDFTRFNPEHFRRIEHYIEALMQLGIQADVIVMHPYDRWGFRNMGAEADDLYWHYVVNRFSAYRNVWWSLNEYDFMPETIADWERYASIILKQDPYNRLRSIHNGPEGATMPALDYPLQLPARGHHPHRGGDGQPAASLSKACGAG